MVELLYLKIQMWLMLQHFLQQVLKRVFRLKLYRVGLQLQLIIDLGQLSLLMGVDAISTVTYVIANITITANSRVLVTVSCVAGNAASIITTVTFGSEIINVMIHNIAATGNVKLIENLIVND
jgi:hypothetical protein